MGPLRRSKKVKENEAEIARLRQELTNAEAGYRTRTATANSQSLKQQLDALQVQYMGRETTRVNELRALVRDLEEEKQTLQDSNTSLDKDLGVFGTTVEQRTVEVSARDATIQELQDQHTIVVQDLNRLREEWQSRGEAYEENEKKWIHSSRQQNLLLESTKQAHRGVREQLRRVTVELERLQATSIEKENLLLATQRDLEYKGRENEDLRQQTARLQKDLDEKTETLATARLNLNQTRNQLNIEMRKVRTFAQEKAEKDKKIEFMQQQCVSMHLNLTAPAPFFEVPGYYTGSEPFTRHDYLLYPSHYEADQRYWPFNASG